MKDWINVWPDCPICGHTVDKLVYNMDADERVCECCDEDLRGDISA